MSKAINSHFLGEITLVLKLLVIWLSQLFFYFYTISVLIHLCPTVVNSWFKERVYIYIYTREVC